MALFVNSVFLIISYVVFKVGADPLPLFYRPRRFFMSCKYGNVCIYTL